MIALGHLGDHLLKIGGWDNSLAPGHPHDVGKTHCTSHLVLSLMATLVSDPIRISVFARTGSQIEVLC